MADSVNETKLLASPVHSGVAVLGNGRLDIDLSDRSFAGWLARLEQHHRRQSFPEQREQSALPYTTPVGGDTLHLRLNIVIHVVGSRGDVQPFLALGKRLKKCGHRVRLATHLAFQSLVRDNGLEFFSIGGNPTELMTYMVKNAGLLPEFKTVRTGAVGRQRQDMKDIMNGCWRSCFTAGDGTSSDSILNHNIKLDDGQRPFVADAIIANPPSMAHIHCAERLGVPLTIIFTMPWSPTKAFPHPLANVHRHHTRPTIANLVSYNIVDMVLWGGLGGIINTLRRKSLGLDILDAAQAVAILHRLRIPNAYLWSPALLEKPPDWGDHIDICGFASLPVEVDYRPPDDLFVFLQMGPAPIYIGFGSIVVDNPRELSDIVIGAIERTGQRAIISKGWSGLDTGALTVPDHIFLLGECPHNWLFQYVSCVVHHGGAGTTQTGLKFGCPTVVIPFFGDQPFWGSIIADLGVGPIPVPYKELTIDRLADAIREALKPPLKRKAREISHRMSRESGLDNAVSSFHRHLPQARMRCALCPARPAVWKVKESRLVLSAFAMVVLVEAGLLAPRDLELYRAVHYDTSRDPQNPFSATSQALLGSISKFVTDIGDIVSNIKDVLPQRSARSLYAPQSLAEHINGSRTYSVRSDSNTMNQRNDLISSDGRVEVGSDQGRQLPSRNSNIRIPVTRRRLRRILCYTSHLSRQILDLIVIPPTEITLTLTRGIHNAPRLLHDDTVERVPKVTGARNGMKTAGQELILSIYKGVSGLVTLPYRGFKELDGKGLFKGIGNGAAGLLLKPMAGLCGLAAYPLAGFHEHLQKSLAEEKLTYIKEARIAEGFEEVRNSSFEERRDVVQSWRALHPSSNRN